MNGVPEGQLGGPLLEVSMHTPIELKASEARSRCREQCPSLSALTWPQRTNEATGGQRRAHHSAEHWTLEKVQVTHKFILDIPKSMFRFSYVWEHVQLKISKRKRDVKRRGYTVCLITISDKNTNECKY